MKLLDEDREKMTAMEKREMLDEYMRHTFHMMVYSGALDEARELEHGFWCIQFVGGEPIPSEHGLAMMLATGFRLGVKHYHDYRAQQRELAVCLAEVDAEAAEAAE